MLCLCQNVCVQKQKKILLIAAASRYNTTNNTLKRISYVEKEKTRCIYKTFKSN